MKLDLTMKNKKLKKKALDSMNYKVMNYYPKGDNKNYILGHTLEPSLVFW